jgi:hypothetical protein
MSYHATGSRPASACTLPKNGLAPEPIALPLLVRTLAANGNTENRVQLEMRDIRSGKDIGRTVCLSFKASGAKNVFSRTKAWITTRVNNAGYTLYQLRKIYALTEPMYLERSADPTSWGTPANEIIDSMCQSVLAGLKSKIAEMATVDIAVRQAIINHKRLSPAEAETIAALLNDVVIPALIPLWKESILPAKDSESASGSAEKKIIQEVSKWKKTWNNDAEDDNGGMRRLANYRDGKATPTLKDSAHLRDLAEQLLLAMDTGYYLQRLMTRLVSRHAIVFDDERKIMKHLRPALRRILGIQAALPKMRIKRAQDSWESSDCDTATASTYRLSFSDEVSGKNSMSESANSISAETPAVTEVTLERDMRPQIDDFLSTIPDRLRMESEQWEGFAASAQTTLLEIGSETRLKRADTGVKREVETILRTLIMACTAKATESLPGSSRKRARSSDGSSDASAHARRRIPSHPSKVTDGREKSSCA